MQFHMQCNFTCENELNLTKQAYFQTAGKLKIQQVVAILVRGGLELNYCIKRAEEIDKSKLVGHVSLFRSAFNKFSNTGAQML